jgi:hypothetical protein
MGQAGYVQVGTTDDYFTTRDLSLKYRTPESTVRYWRMINYGPRGTKVGRRVLYARAEVERFDAELAAQAAEKSADGAA